jgi:hypothetical protein
VVGNLVEEIDDRGGVLILGTNLIRQEGVPALNNGTEVPKERLSLDKNVAPSKYCKEEDI